MTNAIVDNAHSLAWILTMLACEEKRQLVETDACNVKQALFDAGNAEGSALKRCVRY